MPYPVKKRKERACAVCGATFSPKQGYPSRVCGIACALDLGRSMRAKEQAKKDRAWKKANRKTSYYLEAAQKSFNAYIRERDKHLPCVSCGRWHNGKWNAGHYRPVGGQGAALRYNELNCHRQCEPCNTHKSGALTEYRIELIRRIGLSLVEWLERDHKMPQKWTKEELIGIRDYYRYALKAMREPDIGNEPF